jgi:3-deoxy-D-manno-octulosonic acid kinase
VAQQPLIGAMQEVLAAHRSLYEWAAEIPQPRALRGRAPVYVATLPGTEVVVAVRHAWHGGMLAPLTGDRFRFPTRAPVELENALRLRALGIRTTELVGYARYPAGPTLRRVDVASRFIPDAVDFGAVLAALAPAITPNHAIPAVVELLVQLARHRVHHPDLNVKNILLSRDVAGGLHALVIDVDVIRVGVSPAPDGVMDMNLRRLARSIRKWHTRFGIDAGDEAIAALERQSRNALAATSS